MPDLEVIVLIVGLVSIAGAVVVGFLVRDRQATESRDAEPAPGLIQPAPTWDPPAGITPGMVGPLEDGEVDPRDVRITMVDLASRGYLRLTALVDDRGRCFDWIVSRTDKGLDAGLLAFERTLLTQSFEPAEPGISPNGYATLSGMLAARESALELARDQLADEMQTRGWFDHDERRRTSPWGWSGAVVLVIGLLTTAYMLIDWLARGDFRGVVGGILLTATGIVLTSLGRRRGPHTDSGTLARTSATAFRKRLAQLQAEDVDPSEARELFSRLLPWAIAYEVEGHVGKAVEDELRRAASWGRQVDVRLDWYTIDNSDAARSPREITAELASIVRQRQSAHPPRRVGGVA